MTAKTPTVTGAILAVGLLASACDALLPAMPEPEAVTAADPASVEAAELAGEWTGVLDLGRAQLNLVLQLSHGEAGLSGNLISVDQGGAVIALDPVTLEGATFRFEDRSRGAAFEGVVTDDGRISGVFTQRGLDIPLTFERAAAAEANEEAEPAETNPFESEVTVTTTNLSSGEPVSLTGILRQPEADARATVVILSGSGPQDRDGNIAGQALYAAWADLMAEAGVASLRLDDRGVGGSDRVVPAGPADLAGDAVSALELARAETGAQCLGYVGHSEGGWIGLMAGPDAGADFVVSMAGMHEPMETTLSRQSEAMIRAAGGGDAAVAANARLQQAMFDVLRVAQADDDIVADLEAALAGAGAPAAVARQQAAIWGQPYAAASFQADPREAAAAFEGSVLALFGGNDLQVLAEPNAAALASSRDGLPTRSVTIEGVDHLFQANETGAVSSYGSAGHAIAPEAATTFINALDRLIEQSCE